MYIPPGFNTVTPYFFVADAEAFVRFLVQGLGGIETCRSLRPNGLILNVQVKLGTSTVMVSEATERYKPDGCRILSVCRGCRCLHAAGPRTRGGP